MSVIDRAEATSRAHDYLSKTGANNWKQGDELKRRSDGKSYMAIVNLIADIYQRGERPSDLDLQRIDFSVSTSNIQDQIDELLKKRGAEQFEKEKEAKIESDMEKAEELIKEDQEEMEETRRQTKEELDEMMGEDGKLFEARTSAWTGYQLASLDTRGMFNPLIEMIEYARGILSINEDLEQEFDGHFEVLRERKEKLEELADEIEDLNLKAETDEFDEDEEQEEEASEEDIRKVVKDELTEGEEFDEFEVIDQVRDRIQVSEDAVLNMIDRLKVEGQIYEPQPSMISLLDEEAMVLSDHRKTLSDEDMETITKPFGEVTLKLSKPKEPELEEIESFVDAKDFLTKRIGDQPKEHVMAIYLEGDQDVLGTQTLSVGGIQSVDFSERSIIQTGIMMNATAVILAHNHPSGKAEFTQQDREATIEIKEMLEDFNIKLLDMLVVTDSEIKSMAKEGGVL